MPPRKKTRLANLKAHKMPEESAFYDKVMPVLFIGLTVVMVVLILFAIGVLAGIVPWV